MYRARPEKVQEKVIDVIRILHDAMDFARRVPPGID